MAYRNIQVAFKGLEPYNLNGVTVRDEELGTGSYATVLKVDYLGLKCAGKKIHKVLLGEEANSMTYTVQRFKDECQILSQVRHPNIVQFLGVLFQPGDHIPMLVMEYLPLNLDQCLEKHNLPNDTQYSILHDVALGLHYLHSQRSPIIHRDLSSNNILLTSNIRAKISDLGVARILNLSPQKVTRLTKAPGTPAFMPPEVMVADPKYDTSVDVFSYGILMIHTMSGKMPIPQIESVRTEGDDLIAVSEAERRGSFLEVIGNDHPLMELILKCIHNNPGKRTNTSEIVSQLADMVEQHPIQFTSQLDMIEYISQLEKQSESLERENLDYRNSQLLENAKQTREAISKLEKKQEEDKMEELTLLQTMEHAINDLKISLTGEVKKMLNSRTQSTSRDLDQLIEEVKRAETCTADTQSSAPCQRRTYENTLPIHREKSGAAKSKHVQIASDTLPASVKHSTKNKTKEREPVVQVNQGSQIHPPHDQLKPHPKYQNVKVDENEAGKTLTTDETKPNEQAMRLHLEPYQKRTHTRSSSTGNTEGRIASAVGQSPQPRPKSVSGDSPTDAKFGLQHTQVPQKNTFGESKASQQPKADAEECKVRSVGLERNEMSKLGMTTDSESNSALRYPKKYNSEDLAEDKSKLSQPRPKSVPDDSDTDATSANSASALMRHPQKRGSKVPSPVKSKPQGPPPVPPKYQERKSTTSAKEQGSSTRKDTKSRSFTVSEIVEKVSRSMYRNYYSG